MRRLMILGLALGLPCALIGSASLVAQPGPGVTAADYARAEKFLAQNLTGAVVGGAVAANWLSDDRFWYRNALADGAEFVLVDPAKKTRASLRSCAGRCRPLPGGRRIVRCDASPVRLDRLPNQNHGYGTASPYMMRRRWDFFVRWLQNVEPPKEYQMQPAAGGRGGS